ncbi:hypothetical protein F0U44_13280 [Nocardioides humilatus]|uniref:Uncharacterized protein n=1 Tax=Nocardioides humilatus TaxID=2607660 RepID=A0A5B1LFG4_9ACTN|nr:hypothetical protein [Nocardioides humilatus]KAA1419402.1 hypothetical protein F0U44_13280 [Nocardioides humilatus]
MVRRQTITLTPLPNGRAPGGKVRLSVHIAPRLETDEDGAHPVLGQFPDFARWVQLSQEAGLTFQVKFGGDDPVDATFDEAHEPDPSLWEAIFRDDCGVQPLHFKDFDGQKLRSFPAANIHKYLKNLYTSFGLSDPTEFPTAHALLAGGALGTFASDPTDEVRSRLHQKVEQLIAVPSGPAPRIGVIAPHAYSPASVGVDITQVQILHRPRPKGTHRVPYTAPPDFDFHQGIAALAAHPQLLRRLGLVRDLLVTPSASYTAATEVQVFIKDDRFLLYPVGSATYSSRIVSTRTRYRSTTFTAAPRTKDPLLFARRLNLSDPRRYDVADVDLDGAALKVVGAASTIGRSVKAAVASPLTSDRHPLPAMRSEGLVLLQVGRASSLQAEMKRQRSYHDLLLAGQPPVLDAEDLVRGYYLDVWDDTAGHWSPLGMRNVVYTPVGQDPLEVEDEGAVTMAVTTDGQGSPLPDVFVPETLAKWSGWSVVAPRPGRALAKDLDDGMVGRTDTSEATAIKLGITTTVPKPGSDLPKLPSLRYGRSYRFRARAADFAGNSEPFTDINGDNRGSTPLTVYSRYEPVPPPIVLKHEDPTPGDGVLRMVIRSDYDEVPGNADPAYRHLVPPVASQLVVEQAGVLDTPEGRLDPGTYEVLRVRDGNRLDNPDANNYYPDPTSPFNEHSSPELIYPDDFVNVTHLPDPFSRGAVFYGLPFGTTKVGGHEPAGGTAHLSWNLEGDTWDTVLANRIRLSEPRGVTNKADYAHRILTFGRNQELRVFLPKATVVRTKLSSFLSLNGVGPTSDVDRMGIWRWLLAGAAEAGLSTGAQNDLKKLVAAGAHWMISPSVEIELVHAVRRPLLRPTFTTTKQTRKDAHGDDVDADFANVAADRQPGETAAHWTGTMQVSGRSTARVNVIADWHEDIDNVDLPSWDTVGFHAQPCSFTYDSDDHELFPIAAANGKPVPIRADTVRGLGLHELHDTRHRMVTYTVEAVSRFAEEFTKTITPAIGPLRKQKFADNALVPGYTRISDNGVTYEEGTDFLINDPAPGWIRVPVGSPVSTGHPITLTFLEGPVSRFSTEPATQTERTTTTVNVLSTARPKAPQVEYLIPAYEWTPLNKRPNADTTTRQGNRLRVWLGRPWFSSGDGEQLAVICPTAGVQPDAMDPLHTYVSLIGMDPVWGDVRWEGKDLEGRTGFGVPTRTVLKPANFPLADRKIDSGIFLEGIPSLPGAAPPTLGAAVHDVHYDRERKLWYCDIQISPADGKAQPYLPFVQLALARFQASSLNDDGVDLRLSPIVVAELVQLAPDRVLTITKKKGRVSRLNISGTSYKSTPATDHRHVDDQGYVGSVRGPARMTWEIQTPRVGMDPDTFPDTAWERVGVTHVMPGTVDHNGLASWTVDKPVLVGNRPARLVFTEYEEYDDTGDNPGRVVFTATYPL